MKPYEETYKEEEEQLDDEDIEQFQKELEDYDIEPIKETFDDRFYEKIAQGKRESKVKTSLTRKKKTEARKVKDGF